MKKYVIIIALLSIGVLYSCSSSKHIPHKDNIQRLYFHNERNNTDYFRW